MKNIAFVASNPSHLGTDSPAKKILRKWIDLLGVGDYYSFYNVSNIMTPKNRPLKKSEYELGRLMEETIEHSRFIALGNTASDALSILGIRHFKLPHPSPKNRLLNDKEKIIALLKECRVYLENVC